MDNEIDEIFNALKYLDKQSVLDLLDGDYDPNYFVTVGTATGLTCYLYKAVTRNEVEIVEKLLKKGADANFEDDEGETPLFAALESDKDPSIQEILYAYGANRNHKNKAGNTPLMSIALSGSEYGLTYTDKTVFNLLSGCEHVKDTNTREQSLIHLIPFVHSCEKIEKDEEHTCRKYLRILTANGVSVNIPDGSSLTPMHYACKTCCFDAVSFLFENGADVNLKTNSGQSVLHLLGSNSDRQDFPAILDFLINKGCSLAEFDSRGRNILHIITESNKVNRKAVELVLSYGLDPNKKDSFGLTPLHLITIPSLFTSVDHIENDEERKFDVTDVVVSLVGKGADINATDQHGLTPLHYILRYEEKTTTVETLLSLGADVTLSTKTGETALHRATLYSNLLQVVIKHTTSDDLKKVLNLKDRYGSTALHWAIYYFETDSVKILLQKGADVTCLDDKGRSPSQLAIYLKRTEVFEHLGIIYCRETYPLPYIMPDDVENDIFLKEISDTDSDEDGDGINKILEQINSMKDESDESASDETSCSQEAMSNSSLEFAYAFDVGTAENDMSEEEEEKCVGVDHMWCDCPLLGTLHYEDKILSRKDWKDHLLYHRRAIVSYIKLICESKEMGLYHETDENDLVAKHIHRLLDFLAKEMKIRNSVLQFSLKLAGSWSEGTKVVVPEEFDFKLILENFGDKFEPIEVEEAGLNGFVKFALKKEYSCTQFSSYVNEHGFLDGRKVVRALYEALNAILIDLPSDILLHLYPVKYLDTENGSIDNISFRWVGWTYKNMLIDIDIVPSIVPSDWVPGCFIQTRKLLQNREDMPFPVVIKTPNSRFTKNWNTFFRISMADREVAIFSSIPGAYLKGYILVKSLLRTMFFPQVYDVEHDKYRAKCLTSYLLKTSFLHELEHRNAQNDEISATDSKTVVAIKMALSIVRRLLKAVKENYLEPYFLSGVNTLVNDSQLRFNNEIFYESEVKCIKNLLKLGHVIILKEEEKACELGLLKYIW